MTASKLQRLLLWGAWLVAAVLLSRFSMDFVKEMPMRLAAPFVLLVAAARTTYDYAVYDGADVVVGAARLSRFIARLHGPES